MNTMAENLGAILPHTIADLKQTPELRREVLVTLARRGIASCRALSAGWVAQFASFGHCNAQEYAPKGMSLCRAVRAHDGRVFGLLPDRIAAHVRAADTLVELAAAAGLADPEFGELRALVDAMAAQVEMQQRFWVVERKRLLREAELDHVRYTKAVRAVHWALTGESEAVTADAG